MACQNTSELTALTAKEYAKLSKLIAPLDEMQAEWEVDGTSIRNVIGHRAHWIELFLGWYHDGLAGKEVHFPAAGYKWNELKRYNADLRLKQIDLSWVEVCALLQSRHDQLTQFIAERTDEDLYAGPMRGAKNKWTPGRWAEAAGPSHYRSVAKFIRSVLRANA